MAAGGAHHGAGKPQRQLQGEETSWRKLVRSNICKKALYISIWMTKEQHVCPASVSYMPNGAFQSMGVPPNHSFYQMFHEININKPSSHWGTPMAMEPPWLWHSARNSKATALRDELSSVNRPHGYPAAGWLKISTGYAVQVEVFLYAERERDRDRERERDIYIYMYIYR